MTASVAVEQPDSSHGAGSQPVRMWLLGYALAGGVAWWVLHLGSIVVLVPVACEYGVSWLINLDTAVTAVGAATTIAAGAAIRRRAGATSLSAERNRVLGQLAMLFNGISLALIVLEGAPNLFLGPCP